MRLQLQAMEWKPDPAMFDSEAEMAQATKGGMLALYEGWWRDFGELLVDIEQRGIHVDEEYLEAQSAKAQDDVSSITAEFLEWAGRNVCEDAALMNLASNKQKNQLFFGGMMVKVAKAGKLEAPPITVSAGQVLDVPWVVGLELIQKGVAEFEPSEEWGQTMEEAEFRVQETENLEQYVEEGRDKPRRMRSIKLSSLKLKPLGYTATGGASCSGPVLKQLAGYLPPILKNIVDL
jgi:DNA polymerase-1